MSIFTNWGSSADERRLDFTCDKVIEQKNGAYFRAVDIKAPSDLVYRWICQMKVAPYSYDRLDNKGKQSPQYLTPGLEKLQVGDKMMTIFNVDHFIPNKEVTLQMDVPPKPYDKFYVPTAITYRILPDRKGVKGHCRVIVKYVASWKHTFLGNAERLFIIVADFIMMRRQLLNFKMLAERDYGQSHS
jgi:hypothetical protein